MSPPPGVTPNRRARLLLGACLFVALLLLLLAAPVDDWLFVAVTWSEANPRLSAALYVLFAAVAAVLFMPGSIIAMLAGYLYGMTGGSLLALLGLTLGAAAAFFCGRVLVRDWVSAELERRPRLKALDSVINERSFLIIALLRASVVIPFNLLNYTLGVTGVRASAHAAATALGMIPATLLWTYAGTLAKSLADIRSGRVQEDLPSGYLLVFGLIVLAVVVVIVHRAANRALSRQLEG